MMTNIDLFIEDEIAEYIDFLNDADAIGDSILTPQRIDKNFNKVGEALNMLLAYPDLLIDIISPPESDFRLYFYQRLFLRSMSRHRQSYTVATRGASKTFNAFTSRWIMAMSVPRHKTFVCTEIKNQAVALATQTIDDLWTKFPLFKNEMVKIPQPGKAPTSPFKSGQGYLEYHFSSGSQFDVISVDTARGKRRHSGIIEELIEQDVIKINEKVIPVMNIGRRSLTGKFVATEPHAQKIFVTTAGYHGTFAYEKFIETLLRTAIDPDNNMVISMTYRVPMMHGLLEQSTIRDLKSSPTFSKESFNREYGSQWSGQMKGAAFDYDTMVRARKVFRAEYKAASNFRSTGDFYVMSADMAKDGSANTAVVILRISPREYNFLYKVVNAFKIESTDYEKVAQELKQAAAMYDVDYMVYDATGIGASIRDWLNKDSRLPSGEILPGLGIINPPEKARKDLIQRNKKQTICYELKVSGPLNSEINSLFFGRLKSGSVKLLVPLVQVLRRLENNKDFINSSVHKKQKIVRPYQITDILQEELLNLDILEVSDHGGATLKVKRRNDKIQKDFFSALSYGIYVAHVERELEYYKRKRAKKRKVSNLFRFSG